MKLILIRHGETEENAAGTVQGQIDGTLSKLGIAQATAAGKMFKNKNFDAIYTSDLGRAFETAKEIAKYHDNTKLIKDKRLREINFGIAQGKHGRDPSLSPGWEAFNKDLWNGKVEGGETNTEVRQRVMEFINELLDTEPKGTFLVVTHGGPIRHVRSMVSSKPTFRELLNTPIENTETVEFEITKPLELNIQ